MNDREYEAAEREMDVLHDQITALTAERDTTLDALKVNELRDDLDEIVMLLQDFALADDHTARVAASALLSQAINTFNGTPGDPTPSEHDND